MKTQTHTHVKTAKKHASTATTTNHATSTLDPKETAMKKSDATIETTASTTTLAKPAASSPAATPATSSSIFIPSEEAVSALVAQLDAVATLLGTSATPLTTDERKRVVRQKKGAEATVGLMAGLGQQYNVQLPGIDPAVLKQYSALVSRLQPLETKLRVVTSLVSDTVTNAKSESWEGATALYTALTRSSKRNAALQRELKPAVAFFKRGTPAKGAAKTTKGTKAAATMNAAPETESAADASPAATADATAAAPAVTAAPAAPAPAK